MLRKVYSGTDTLAASKAIDKVIISKVKFYQPNGMALIFKVWILTYNWLLIF